MLNRIRRAASLTRERYFSKGRHRRPLTPSRPLAAPASAAPDDASTVVMGQASAGVIHRRPLRGEDVALVRPYLVAWEERVRTRAVVVAPRLPADAWSALAGVR
ncbi:hypothetical protein [Streptomyces brevispora]|uniref:hypothetical protein n=1 Tax=Streptomyces brevispora TaxID=887462 RepID=UPI00398D1872